MKYLAIVVVLAGAALGGYYYGSPYLAVADLRDAVASKNSENLSELIEFPAVRQSLKEQMTLVMMTNMKKEAADNPFALIGAGFATNIVDGMIDGFVSPSGLSKILENEDGSGPAVFDNVELEYPKLDKFIITIQKDKEPLRIVMRRSGFAAWKITEMRIPTQDMFSDDK